MSEVGAVWAQCHITPGPGDKTHAACRNVACHMSVFSYWSGVSKDEGERVELFGREPLIGQSHAASVCVTQHLVIMMDSDDKENENYGENKNSDLYC